MATFQSVINKDRLSSIRFSLLRNKTTYPLNGIIETNKQSQISPEEKIRSII